MFEQKVIARKGMLSLEVGADWMAGHGPTGKYRWAVRWENEHRPAVEQDYSCLSLDRAVAAGMARFRALVAEGRGQG